jgi:hypothetical protein
MSTKRIPERFQVWITARRRHCLSHAHVQMARELGMNPKKQMELGTRIGRKREAQARIAMIREAHAEKRSFIERLRKAGLIQRKQ